MCSPENCSSKSAVHIAMKLKLLGNIHTSNRIRSAQECWICNLCTSTMQYSWFELRSCDLMLQECCQEIALDSLLNYKLKMPDILMTSYHFYNKQSPETNNLFLFFLMNSLQIQESPQGDHHKPGLWHLFWCQWGCFWSISWSEGGIHMQIILILLCMMFYLINAWLSQGICGKSKKSIP